MSGYLWCPIPDCDETRPHNASHWVHRSLDYEDGGRRRDAVAHRCKRAAEFLQEHGLSRYANALVADPRRE